MVHFLGWIFFARGTYFGCGDTCYGGVWGDVLEDDAAGSDLGSGADFYSAENLGTGSDEDAGADDGVACSFLFAGSSEGDFVHDGDVVFYDGGFSDDYAGGVVDEDAAADLCAWVDVYAEDFTGDALEVEG